MANVVVAITAVEPESNVNVVDPLTTAEARVKIYTRRLICGLMCTHRLGLQTLGTKDALGKFTPTVWHPIPGFVNVQQLSLTAVDEIIWLAH